MVHSSGTKRYCIVCRVATHPGFLACCPTSWQDQPRDGKCPGFQDAVKMMIITIVIITIVIIGAIVLL